jgi:hypothetical protein
MTVYWIGCAASALLACLCSSTVRGRENRAASVFFSALPLIFLSALRYDVGYDYLPTYVGYFNLVKNNMVNDANRLEWLWHLINKALNMVNADPVWLFVVAALIFFLTVYSEIFRDSPYPALSVFLLVGMGYLFVSFNAVRQMVGCGILLYSVRYVEEKKLWKFLLLVLIAGGFHNSCYVFAAVYWLSRVRIRPLLALLLTAAVVVLMGPITQLIHFIISKTDYRIYIASIFDTGETAYIMLAINFIVLVFASVLYRDEPRYRAYYNFQVLALWITLYSGQVVLILRLMWAFGLPAIILVPLGVETLKEKKDRRLVMAVLVVMYFLYTMYTVGIQNSNSVLPYQTVFSRWLP